MNFCKMVFGRSRWLLLTVFFTGAQVAYPQNQGDGTLLYSTGFEAGDGYDLDFTLVGQSGWVGTANGGNGLVEEFFVGMGQQAFVGSSAPEEDTQFLNVWQPINLDPVPPETPIVKFSVVMRVVDSTNDQFDDFRWSAYNSNGERLFTLDFDNSAKEINYALDDGGFVSTGFQFDNNGVYDLVMYLNFQRNLWTAQVNGVAVVNSQPITSTGIELNLGDIDAVWAIRDSAAPGDNYMLFDDYTVTAESIAAIPPTLETLGVIDGEFNFRFFGEEGLNYAIEVSANLTDWESLGVFEIPAGGTFDFRDTTSPEFSRSFYRAKLVTGNE